MMTDKKLLSLSPIQKKIATHILSEEGYSTRKIERVLGIDYSTASLYLKEEKPEDIQQFSTVFKNVIAEKKAMGIAAIHKRLLELIPKEKKIDQLVKGGEFLEGKSQQPLIQNNVVINDLKAKYGI